MHLFFQVWTKLLGGRPAKRLTGDVLRLLQVLKKGHSCRFYSMCWSTGGRQLWTHQLFICKWGGNSFLIIIIYFCRNASLNTVQSGFFFVSSPLGQQAASREQHNQVTRSFCWFGLYGPEHLTSIAAVFVPFFYDFICLPFKVAPQQWEKLYVTRIYVFLFHFFMLTN